MTEDRMALRRLLEKIADALSNAELVILDTLKHAVMLEAPARVAEAVGRFLDAQA